MIKKFSVIMLFATTLTGCHLVSEKKPTLSSQYGPVILEQSMGDDIIVPVVINNQTYHFLVDTAASVTFIDDALAKKITRALFSHEIPANYKQEFSSIQTFSGKLSASEVTFLKPLSLYIGSEQITDHDLWVGKDLSLATQALGIKIDGILGIDTFRKYNWLVDNKNHRLVVTHKAPSAMEYLTCTGYEDHYNGKPQLWFTYRNEQNVGFMVDTGSTSSYIATTFIDYLKQNKLPLHHLPLANIGADASGHSINDDYIIDGFSFDNMPLGKMPFTENTQGMYALGMDFFSRLDRYAFIPTRMMFCYDGKNSYRDNIPHERNIAIRNFNQGIEVFYNNENVLAKYGLKNGDRIINVNGKKYQPHEIKQVRKLILQLPKNQLKLTIQRQHKMLDLLL